MNLAFTVRQENSDKEQLSLTYLRLNWDVGQQRGRATNDIDLGRRKWCCPMCHALS